MKKVALAIATLLLAASVAVAQQKVELRPGNGALVSRIKATLIEGNDDEYELSLSAGDSVLIAIISSGVTFKVTPPDGSDNIQAVGRGAPTVRFNAAAPGDHTVTVSFIEGATGMQEMPYELSFVVRRQN